MTDRVNFRELLAASENLQEGLGASLGTAERRPFTQNDGPRDEGEDRQDGQDHQHYRSRIGDQLKRVWAFRGLKRYRCDFLKWRQLASGHNMMMTAGHATTRTWGLSKKMNPCATRGVVPGRFRPHLL